jgi:hypothetical protein
LSNSQPHRNSSDNLFRRFQVISQICSKSGSSSTIIAIPTIGNRLDPVSKAAHEFVIIVGVARGKIEMPVCANRADLARRKAEHQPDGRNQGVYFDGIVVFQSPSFLPDNFRRFATTPRWPE